MSILDKLIVLDKPPFIRDTSKLAVLTMVRCESESLFVASQQNLTIVRQ